MATIKENKKGSPYDIIELYKLKLPGGTIEESDLLTHIERERGTFYYKNSKLNNDVPSIQAFIDLGTANDILLFRRRDPISFQIIESRCFTGVDSIEKGAIARAKRIYAEQHGIDYDFPRRQIERKLTNAQRSCGIGKPVYDMTSWDLLAAFGGRPRASNSRTPSPMSLDTMNEEPSDGSIRNHVAHDLGSTSDDSASSISSSKLAGDSPSSLDCGHQEGLSDVEAERETSQCDKKDLTSQQPRFGRSSSLSKKSHLQSQKPRPQLRLTINTQAAAGKKRQLSPGLNRATTEAKRRRLRPSPETDTSTSDESQELCSSSSHPESSSSDSGSSGPISESSHTLQAESESDSVTSSSSDSRSSHSQTDLNTNSNLIDKGQQNSSTTAGATNARARRQEPNMHLQKDILQRLGSWLDLIRHDGDATQQLSGLFHDVQELKSQFKRS